MKTLVHKIIIYDDVCPLCKAYTNGFVNLGWLLPDHRVGFSKAPQELLEHIDIDRARHEIPLYDTQTKETLYGKEALFFILGEEFPVFKPLFQLRIFRFCIAGLYQLITYNRRIIAGSKAPADGFDCAPDFNGFYRWLYIGLATIASTCLALAQIEAMTLPDRCLYGLVGIGLIKGLFIRDFIPATDYFGHLATVVLVVHLLAAMTGFNGVVLGVLMLAGVYLMARRVRG